MPLLKGQNSLFRYTGIIAAVTALVEAVIWLLFSAFAVMYYLENNLEEPGRSVAAVFHNMYFSNTGVKDSPTVPPIYIHYFMWYYVILSIVWATVSIRLINVFAQWEDTDKIRQGTIVWIVVTVVVCVSDLILFIIFAVDFRNIVHSYSVEEDAFVNVKSDCILPKKIVKSENLSLIITRFTKDDDHETEVPSYVRERNPFVIDSLKRRWKSTHVQNPFIIYTTENNTPAATYPTVDPVIFKRTEAPDEQVFVNLTMLNRLVVPPAVMMTMASRGYFMWFINTFIAGVILYFYITRRNKPTLITRVKG